jgi:hypothetical protein
MQTIQVQRKRRPEPHPRVANILTLKAKAHFFSVGMLVHGGGDLAAFLGIDMVVCAAAGARRRLRRPQRQNLRINVQIFGDFGGGDTTATGSGACTDRRRHPVEGARARPAAHKCPNTENKQPGHLQARAACQNSSLTKPPPS